MIWHPFLALGCVFMIERIVQEKTSLENIDSVYHIPVCPV
ncbi:hypothetical protein BARD7_01175 [Bacillus amyloliquefaciens]|nr:hypothetical protein BARD7_01175 [Bacillus amyloliquefaciens]